MQRRVEDEITADIVTVFAPTLEVETQKQDQQRGEQGKSGDLFQRGSKRQVAWRRIQRLGEAGEAQGEDCGKRLDGVALELWRHWKR